MSALPFTFTTAAAMPLTAFVSAINLTYPHEHDSVEHYARQLCVAQVDLARSVVALDTARHVAGLAMLGVRGERGWCGDAAVIPPYQNQGLGQALMRRLSDGARQGGLQTITLEVRANNAPARRVYEREGYCYTRRMPCYAANLRELGWLDSQVPPELHIQRASDAAQIDANLLRWYGTRFVARPCWERELPSLLASRGRALWTALRDGRQLACLLGTRNENDRFSIMLLGLTDDATKGDVRALLVAAMGDAQTDNVRIGLEPIDSRCAEMLRDLGFKQDKDLWEMLKTL